ncbi:MAG: hypothetical protein WBL58_04985, partial [Peptococcia bacterium]
YFKYREKIYGGKIPYISKGSLIDITVLGVLCFLKTQSNLTLSNFRLNFRDEIRYTNIVKQKHVIFVDEVSLEEVGVGN